MSVSTKQPVVSDSQRNARRIAFIYIAIGLAWITGSDRLVDAVVAQPHVVIVQMLKGYAYVFLTGYALYVAIARLLISSSETQRRLTESENAYRTLFESHPNPMFIYDCETLRFLAVNQATIDKYGFSRAEFLTMTLRDIRPPELQEEFMRAFNAHKYFEEFVAYGPVRHWTKDRRLLDMQITSNTLQFAGSSQARVVLAQDVSERVRAEQELIKSHCDLKEAQRIARLGSWVIDHRSGVMSLSEQMQRLIALDADSQASDALFQRVHPDDRAALQQVYERAWQGSPLYLEVRTLRDDGDTVHLLLRGELSFRSDGSKQLIGTALDISMRKQHERKMRRSELQYRQLVDLLPEAVLIHCEGRVTFANPAAATLFGAARASDMLGAEIEHFIAVPSKSEAQARFLSLQRGLVAETGFQERLLKKIGGEVFTAQVAAQFVMLDGNQCIQAVVRDISQQKKMQTDLQLANERLLHLSAHMVEVGESERRQLSRELHDDLGQALTFIKMTAAWLRKRLPDPDIAERLTQVNSVAGDALEKVRNLALALRPAQLDALGLKAAIEEHLHRFCAGSGISYTTQLQELSPRPQPALEIALFRIFQEALTNIFRHSGANFIDLSLTRSDAAITLRMVDDGSGFDVAAALARGESLGLHTMTERAQQLRGSLQLHSVAGVGTELIALIPEESE